MRVKIVTVLFAKLLVTILAYGEDDDAYNPDKIEGLPIEDVKVNLLDELDASRARRFEPVLQKDNLSITMEPADVELIKGAIQKLLGGKQIPDYVAPTSPTRTPKPCTPAEPRNSTRSSYTKLLAQLLDYASMVERGKKMEGTPIDDAKVDLLDELGTSKAPREHIVSVTMAPEDVEAIKGAIKKLLGGKEIPVFVAPTSPTRTPGPCTAAEPGNSTTSSYTKLLEQMVEYTSQVEGDNTSEGTQIESMSSITEPDHFNSTVYYYDYDDEKALRFLTRPRRTRKTRRRTRPPPTKNTLCTDSFEYCSTMCFDDEKYRVSCPTTTTQRPSSRMDVNRLLNMLDELIDEYDTNLTDTFNRTLKEKGYISCPPTVTEITVPPVSDTEPTIAFYDYEPSNKTGAVISKCFVCGLDTENIPHDAHCSDAFNQEVLPMVPVDASARAHLATYRKYCKFMDMLPWYVNGTDSRSIWGRWTGGCSVRWVDLSGVYTQRACRNRFHPARGRHFVSRRMARLELALRRVDNGCIISPMASLVPFSRGISLYARFHVCVCTGNWCNRVTTYHRRGPSLMLPFILTITTLSFND